MTLAEIVAEGERLGAARLDAAGNYSAQVAAEGALIDFFLAHYGRLLAVAKAAVGWEAADRARFEVRDMAIDALRAVVRGDAAASGETEEKR